MRAGKANAPEGTLPAHRFMPRQNVQGIRRVTVVAMMAELLLSLLLLRGDYSTGAYQFTETATLVEAYGVKYSVGIDGISLWLVLLTTLITPIATYASWTHVAHSKVGRRACTLSRS